MRATIKLALLVGLVSAPSLAAATTSSNTFNVTLTIVKQCTVTSPPSMNFGSAGATDLLGATMVNSSTYTINCSQGVPYTVGFSSVNDLASGSSTHQLVGSGSNANKVQYNLFDATNGGTTPLNASNNVVSDTGTGANQSKTLKAQVVNYTSAVTADSYTDTVTMTVTY